MADFRRGHTGMDVYYRSRNNMLNERDRLVDRDRELELRGFYDPIEKKTAILALDELERKGRISEETMNDLINISHMRSSTATRENAYGDFEDPYRRKDRRTTSEMSDLEAAFAQFYDKYKRRGAIREDTAGQREEDFQGFADPYRRRSVTRGDTDAQRESDYGAFADPYRRRGLVRQDRAGSREESFQEFYDPLRRDMATDQRDTSRRENDYGIFFDPLRRDMAQDQADTSRRENDYADFADPLRRRAAVRADTLGKMDLSMREFTDPYTRRQVNRNELKDQNAVDWMNQMDVYNRRAAERADDVGRMDYEIRQEQQPWMVKGVGYAGTAAEQQNDLGTRAYENITAYDDFTALYQESQNAIGAAQVIGDKQSAALPLEQFFNDPRFGNGQTVKLTRMADGTWEIRESVTNPDGSPGEDEVSTVKDFNQLLGAAEEVFKSEITSQPPNMNGIGMNAVTGYGGYGGAGYGGAGMPGMTGIPGMNTPGRRGSSQSAFNQEVSTRMMAMMAQQQEGNEQFKGMSQADMLAMAIEATGQRESIPPQQRADAFYQEIYKVILGQQRGTDMRGDNLAGTLEKVDAQAQAATLRFMEQYMGAPKPGTAYGIPGPGAGNPAPGSQEAPELNKNPKDVNAAVDDLLK